MKVEITDSGPDLSESDLALFETQFCPLPEQYRNFLLRFNGGIPTPAEFQFRSGAYGGSVVGEFFSLGKGGAGELNRAMQIYKIDAKRIAQDLIPIATDPSGNQICIGIQGPRYAKIYFWDHEEESAPGEPEENVYLVAPTFDEFLGSLETRPRAEPKPGARWMNRRVTPPEPTVQLTLWDE